MISRKNVFVKHIGILIFSVVLTGVIGYKIGQTHNRQPTSNVDSGQRYDLLAGRIQVENPNDSIIDFRPLQTSLEEYVSDNSLTGKISLFFEYLPTGSSIGIDEYKPQIGASLLKLPLSMSVYKAAEEGALDIDEVTPLKEEWLNNQFGDLYKQGAGYPISTKQAVKEALTQSDNTAALMLYEKVSIAQNTSTPTVLGFIDANYSETSSHEVLIDSRSYASILKCLYFACFLSKDNSQQILLHLTQSVSSNRLTAGVPKDLKIAHKIGNFNKTPATQSDCGILYAPKRNYVLCIMIDEEDPIASEHIANLSRLVYQYTTAR